VFEPHFDQDECQQAIVALRLKRRLTIDLDIERRFERLLARRRPRTIRH